MQDGISKSVQSHIKVSQSDTLLQPQQQHSPSGFRPGRVIPVTPSDGGYEFNNLLVKRPSSFGFETETGPGFDPSKIVFESGFKPIRRTDGPVPPLGFEVEAPSSGRGTFPHNTNNHIRNDPASSNNKDGSNLITADQAFLLNEPDKSRHKNPVPVPLPEAIVPVIPGPAQKVYQDQNPFKPSNRPLAASVRRQPVPAPYTHPHTAPHRKTAGFSLFNLGAQRRQPSGSLIIPSW